MYVIKIKELKKKKKTIKTKKYKESTRKEK